MPIKKLVIEHFRNLHSVEMFPGTHLNLIYGENGSGKTSVLEAIYTLSAGRSFRTRKYKNLIGYGQNAFHIFSEFNQQGLHHKLGVQRSKEGSVFKQDGRLIESAAELAFTLPCRVMDAQSFDLLTGSPSDRRSYIDWIVFHVKHDFRKVWMDYSRCLKQRNSVLRLDSVKRSDLDPWNKTLAKLGEKIDQYREDVVRDLEKVAWGYLLECPFIEQGDFEIRYQPGWDHTHPLIEQLNETFQRDVALGYTNIGPHKADIRFTFNKKPLAELFSRGQQKAVVAAFYLAQLALFQQQNSRSCLLLIDDLPAELDSENVQKVCKWISQLENVQTFLTGIELEMITHYWPSSLKEGQYKMFHVKHGQIIEKPCQWSKS
jgi:DNA replication and repair protein RecF